MYEREILGKLRLNDLTKSTLPKCVSNLLGNVFVPNGTYNNSQLMLSGPLLRESQMGVDPKCHALKITW